MARYYLEYGSYTDAANYAVIARTGHALMTDVFDGFNKITNSERRDVYNAFKEHDRRGGPLNSFFNPGGVYERITNDYSKHYSEGVKRFSPSLSTTARPAAPRPNVFGRIGQQIIQAVILIIIMQPIEIV